MPHPNEDQLRNGYEAFAKGDMEAINALFADDVVFHIGGRSQLSGEYVGKDAVFDFFSKLITLTEGTFQIEVHDVIANDEHGVVITTATARRGDKVLNVKDVDLYHIKDGQVTEFWGLTVDQYAQDEFYS